MLESFQEAWKYICFAYNFNWNPSSWKTSNGVAYVVNFVIAGDLRPLLLAWFNFNL